MLRNGIKIITQFIVVRNSILSAMKISRSECHYPILIRFLTIWFSYICVLQIHLRKDHTVFKSSLPHTSICWYKIRLSIFQVFVDRVEFGRIPSGRWKGACRWHLLPTYGRQSCRWRASCGRLYRMPIPRLAVPGKWWEMHQDSILRERSVSL